MGFALGRLGESPAGDEPAAATRLEPRDLKAVLYTFRAGQEASDVALSPTAEHVAWHDRDGLHVRALDELESRLVVPERPDSVVWSPDGRQLAYSLDDTIWRVELDGGPTTRVARHDERVGSIAWVGNDIYFAAPDVHSAPASGGTIELRAERGDEVQDLHGFDVLPDGGGIVAVTHAPPPAVADTISLYADGEWRPILNMPGESLGLREVRSNGSVLFQRLTELSTVWILPAEPGGGFGEARPLASGVSVLSAADDGTAVYVSQQPDSVLRRQVSWFQLDGSVERTGEGRNALFAAELSPDGERVLYRAMSSTGEPEVWVHLVERGFATLFLTLEAPGTLRYLPDGRVARSSSGTTVAYAPTGVGEPDPLADMALNHVSDDGAIWVWSKAWGEDLVWSRDEHCTDPELLLSRDHEEAVCDLSSDGAWMLYSSKRTGESQVYLSRFPPDATEDWPVSAQGSRRAWFLDDGSAIVFVDNEDPLRAFRVTFETDPKVKLGVPEPLFDLEPGAQITDFDGVGRFVGTSSEPPGERDLVLTTEWKELLR